MPGEAFVEVRARSGLRSRALSADSVAVYDPHSWRTHIVSGAAAMLLALFAERGQQPAAMLAEALALDDIGFSPREADALVARALSELHTCQLIEYAARPFAADLR